jgi:hypothetical protein
MKRLILLFTFALAAGAQSFMPPVQTVQGGFAYSAPLSSLTIHNTTAGNLLATVCGSPTASAGDLQNVTDDRGGTWTSGGAPAMPQGFAVKTFDGAGNQIEWFEMSEFIAWVFYRFSPGGDLTVNFNGGSFPGCTALLLTEFSPPAPPSNFLTLPTFNQVGRSCQHFYPQWVRPFISFGPAPNAYLYGGVLCAVEIPDGATTGSTNVLTASEALDPTLPGWSNPAPSWFSATGR